MLDYLAAERWPAQRLKVQVRAPLRWASPTLYAPDATTHLRLRSDERITLAQVSVRQAGRTLSTERVMRLEPGRGAALPTGWADGADPAGEPLMVEVRAGRRSR